jgi:hypothetical protein
MSGRDRERPGGNRSQARGWRSMKAVLDCRHVGVAHGGVQSTSGTGDPSSPSAQDRPDRSRLTVRRDRGGEPVAGVVGDDKGGGLEDPLVDEGWGRRPCRGFLRRLLPHLPPAPSSNLPPSSWHNCRPRSPAFAARPPPRRSDGRECRPGSRSSNRSSKVDLRCAAIAPTDTTTARSSGSRRANLGVPFALDPGGSRAKSHDRTRASVVSSSSLPSSNLRSTRDLQRQPVLRPLSEGDTQDSRRTKNGLIRMARRGGEHPDVEVFEVFLQEDHTGRGPRQGPPGRSLPLDETRRKGLMGQGDADVLWYIRAAMNPPSTTA